MNLHKSSRFVYEQYLSKLLCNYESIIIQWTNNVDNECLKSYGNLYYNLRLNLIKEPENTIKKERTSCFRIDIWINSS